MHCSVFNCTYMFWWFNRGLTPQPSGKNLLHQKDESKSILELIATPSICQWFLHFLSIFWLFYHWRYYFNKVTKQSKWTIPDELKVFFLLYFCDINICLIDNYNYFIATFFFLSGGTWIGRKSIKSTIGSRNRNNCCLWTFYIC